MKNIFRTVGIAILTLAFAGCNSDNFSLDDARHEQYVRNFIEAFGIPDPDHNYAMAKSAGLHVTTKVGGHVTVTAEVQGKEYLFADLDVTPGTHALPVTIPSSVKELYVNAGKGTHVVATDAMVDIDVAPIQSRTYYVVDDKNNEMEMKFIETGDGGDPYLVFEPQLSTSFFNQIDKYLADPTKDNTDTEIPAIKEVENNGVPVRYFKDSSHETALTCVGGTYDYYIFPIFWKSYTSENNVKKKDYQVYFHKVREGQNDLHSATRIEFCDQGTSTSTNPFPEIGYTIKNGVNIASVDPVNKTYKYLNEEFKFLYQGAALQQAFPTTGNNPARLVLTRGKKIQMKRYKDENKNHYFPGFAIAIKSNIKSDNDFSFVSSAPFYNEPFWKENYFDVPIDRLYQAMVGTKRVEIKNRTDGNPTIIHICDPNINIGEGGEYANGGDWWKLNKSIVHSYSVNFLGLQVPETPFLLGFCSPAAEPGDKTPRQYNQVVFLVTPHVSYREGVSFRTQYAIAPEPLKWTLAAEDLGGSDDWDFNDVVFTFTDVIRNLKSANYMKNVAMISGPMNAQSVRVVTVTPVATGGTMPIYITYTGSNLKRMPEFPSEGDMMFSEANAALKNYLEDGNWQNGVFVLGTEVHKWLGSNDYTKFVNVGDSRHDVGAKSVQFVLPTDYDLGDETKFDYTSSVSKDNKPLFGFAVLVDKDNTLNIDTFNDEDQGFRFVESLAMGEGVYLIGGPSDDKNVKVPQMILVEGDWEWPTERTNIMDAYPNFKDWVKDQTNTLWIMNPNEGKVTKK